MGRRVGLDGGKFRPTWIRSPNGPARSQSLYRMSYPAHTALLLEGKLLILWLGYTHHRVAQLSANIQMLPPNSSRQKSDIKEVPHRRLKFLYARKKNELQ